MTTLAILVGALLVALGVLFIGFGCFTAPSRDITRRDQAMILAGAMLGAALVIGVVLITIGVTAA